MSARARSIVVGLLDRCGNACLRTAAALFTWRERIEPSPVAHGDADRIVAGVRARLEAEAAPPSKRACLTVIAPGEPVIIISDGEAIGQLPPWTMTKDAVLGRWQGTH